MDESTTTILIALVTVGGAGIGFLASSIKDWIANKETLKQKWLDDRRAAYIKFILSFSAPYSSKDIQDYMGNLLGAATEAYLYGNISPPTPFSVHDPFYYAYNSEHSGDAEKKEMALKLKKKFPELKDSTKLEEFINKGVKIENLFDLVLTLSIFRPVIYSDLLQIEGDDEVKNEKRKDAATKFFSDLRQEALGGFMPIFLLLLMEESKSNLASSSSK